MSLIKKLSWILPAVALTTGAFADNSEISNYCDPCPPKEPPECDPCYEKSRNKPYEQGYEICEGALPKAYNAPARIDICDGIDAFVTGSFIYWEPMADQLGLGLVDNTGVTPREFELIKFSYDYKPGFKVGLGTYFSHDDWGLYAQYTRLHSSHSTTFATDTSTTKYFHTPWVFLGGEANAYQFSLIDGNIVSSWKVDFDKIDLELDRYFYVGTNLIVRPYVGGSAHWLDQSYQLTFSYGSAPTTRNLFIKNDSWAVGPRFGFDTKWIFYEGFRLFGNAAASLMFASNESSGNGTQNVTNFTLNKDKQYILRDVEELAIGLGWGSYFTSDKWHFDISVAYDAQRFSNANYMSRYAQSRDVDNSTATTIGAVSINDVKPGDFYLHGLTVTARFDF